MWFPILTFPAGAPSPMPMPFTFDLASLLPIHPLALVPIGFALMLGVILAAARRAARRYEATLSTTQPTKQESPPSMPHAA
jgi:hypothetical protein